MNVCKIEFAGKQYALRLIDFGVDWGTYCVGSTQLLNLLIDEGSRYTSDEARRVDEEIFYFIPVHYYRFSDSRLKSMILSEIS